MSSFHLRKNFHSQPDVIDRKCMTLKMKKNLCMNQSSKNIGTWKLASQKIFSFARKFFNKSFLTPDDKCFTISAKKRKFFDSSILLIITSGKMGGLANMGEEVVKDNFDPPVWLE